MKSRATKITPFRLPDDTLTRLDELCRVSGRSRTAEVVFLIREAYFAEQPQQKKDCEYVADYRSVTRKKQRERASKKQPKRKR